MFTKALIAFFFKFFSVKQLSAVLFSFLASSVLTISIDYLNNLFFKDANIKNVFIPIAVEIFMIGIYTAMVVFDFYFGVRVALYVKKERFDYFRIVDSTVKLIATIMVTSVVTFGSMTLEAMDIDWAWLTSIFVLFFLWIIIILGDFLSIGKNYELLYGSKGRLFNFLEKILSILEKKGIKQVGGNSFNLNTESDEKDNNINPN